MKVEISKKVDKKTFYFVNSVFSNVMISAPKSQSPTFDPPLDASGSELSNAGRIIALRQCLNFEQNKSTKSENATGIQIVLETVTLHAAMPLKDGSDSTDVSKIHF